PSRRARSLRRRVRLVDTAARRQRASTRAVHEPIPHWRRELLARHRHAEHERSGRASREGVAALAVVGLPIEHEARPLDRRAELHALSIRKRHRLTHVASHLVAIAVVADRDALADEGDLELTADLVLRAEPTTTDGATQR